MKKNKKIFWIFLKKNKKNILNKKIFWVFGKKQKNILSFFEKNKKTFWVFGKKQKNILRKFFGKFRQCGLKTFLEKDNQVNKLF